MYRHVCNLQPVDIQFDALPGTHCRLFCRTLIKLRFWWYNMGAQLFIRDVALLCEKMTNYSHAA
jgi:hypothetical protein